MDVLGVDHIDLTVNDLARSAPFYEKVLGALGFRRVPHATYLVWANAHLAIGLRAAAPAAREAAFDRYRVGLHHFALRVRRRDEVDRVHDLLRRARLVDEPACAGLQGRDARGVAVLACQEDQFRVGVLAQGPERGGR